MLRFAARSATEKGTKQVLTEICRESSNLNGPPLSGGKGGGFVKKLVLGVGVAGATAGGALAYASVDPEFRKMIETTTPQIKIVTNAMLGPVKAKAEIFPLLAPSLKKEVVVPVSAPVTAEPKLDPVHVDPVDVMKTHVEGLSKPDPISVEAANKIFEAKLLAALEAAEKKNKDAYAAKINTIAAVEEHGVKLRETVDAGSNANWNTVSETLIKAEKLAKIDMAAEADSRNYIDNLYSVISQGKKDSVVAMNPLLLNALETANKFVYQLDELNTILQKARNESRVLNQYKDLIEKSRQQFAIELRAILPDVDINAKDSKLTEDELNALIAHAHLRVDQLRRQLIEQQVFEEQNIAKAIEQQRAADAMLAEEQLSLELKRAAAQQVVEVERQVQLSHSKWEIELEERLKRATQAHSEHLEQVIRTQKQLHDIENAQVVEQAVTSERRLHSKQFELALSKLSGIETALQSRVALDAENRRAKQCWLACQNLVESIIHGKKAAVDLETRRKPLEHELYVIEQACEKDEFVQNIISLFPKVTLNNGVYTEQDLKNRFQKLYSIAKRTAKIDDNGGGVVAYVSSYIQSLFMLDLPCRYSADDKIDINNIDTYEIISRAKYFVNEGDFDNAVRVLQLLRGEPGRLARDWIRDTQEHLATRFLAELLVSHSAVSSIRSVY